MLNSFEKMTIHRKNGGEPFHASGAPLAFDLLGFWQWSSSDLVSNVSRGRLAEYIVASALGIDTTGVRDEWAAFDLQTPSGVKVEVKSAAFVQSWHQSKLSSITFVTPATRAWDPETNVLSSDQRRQADVYVFALLCHTAKTSVDPLNVHQWRFYVLPTSTLNARTRSQHSITLRTLETLGREGVASEQLARSVEEVANDARRSA